MSFKMEERDERAALFVVRVSHDAANAPMSSSFVNKQAQCACFEVRNCLRLQIKAILPSPQKTEYTRRQRGAVMGYTRSEQKVLSPPAKRVFVG